MISSSNSLIDMVPEFPNIPEKEIAKDSYIRCITNQFGQKCQKQLLISGPLTGKTNFLAQFARYYKDRVISYFITQNPITQDLRTYLLVLTNQMLCILDKPTLPNTIRLDDLKNSFPSVVLELNKHSRENDSQFYFVIDNIDQGVFGDKGNRIVDFPLITFSTSPYIVCSSRNRQFDIPGFDTYTKLENVEYQLAFNLNDTKEYLSNLSLELNEISVIHDKSKGLPGYISLIYEAIVKQGDSWIKDNELPNNLESLIKKQIGYSYKILDEKFHFVLELIAVSPIPLPIYLLCAENNIDVDDLLIPLINTGLIKYDEKEQKVHVFPDYTREALLKKISTRKNQLIKKLIDIVKNHDSKNDLLITLLQKESEDYIGIIDTLSNEKIISVLSDDLNLNQVSNKVQIAKKMAYDSKNSEGLLRWSSTKLILDQVLSQFVSFQEITTLIAIGESQEALKRAYTITDPLNKIRLLSRAYTTIKDRGELIPMEALNELILLVEKQNFIEYDSDLILSIAYDLFPILPECAVSIIDKKFNIEASKSAFDVAFKPKESTEDITQDNKQDLFIPSAQFGFRFLSTWLTNLAFDDLNEYLDEIKNTQTKEFIIRQWCRQNLEQEDLMKGLDLWLDTIIRDDKFVIPLRSLRKISETVKYIPKENQRDYVYKFDVPSINSIRTPWEEWIGFQLNLLDVLFIHDPKLAKGKLNNVYEIINLEINDLDVKVFCYARLWLSVVIMDKDLEETVKANFERVYSVLLENSAIQDEISVNPLKMIAQLNLDYAIEKALEINTQDRRQNALLEIFNISLRKRPDQVFTTQLEKILNEFDEFQKDKFILNLTRRIEIYRPSINDVNQDVLLKHTRKILDHSLRAQALANLLTIWTNEKNIKKDRLFYEIIISWEKEADLRIKIKIGHKIIESISQKYQYFSKQIYSKIKDIYLLPGAPLAYGELGSIYYQTLIAAINSLSLNEISNHSNNLQSIYLLIDKIPSELARICLIGQVAARAYTIGYNKEAEDLINKKILPGIENIENSYDKQCVIDYCLPVIFKYHKETAIELVSQLPDSLKDSSWLFTAYWTLTLGSLRNNLFTKNTKIICKYPTINDYTLVALKNVNKDTNIFSIIESICDILIYSNKHNTIDGIQASKILFELENIVSTKLPDNKNITHEGYLLISRAAINNARGNIYKQLLKKGGLSKIDVRKTWDDIIDNSRKIKNIADRVFVMVNVARKMFDYEEEKAIDLLDEADKYIDSVPAIIDRSDRLEEIGKTYGLLGDLEKAKYIIDKATKLIDQMTVLSQENKLEVLVQAAYEFNPDFADQLVTRFDSRYPVKTVNPLYIENEKLKLIDCPDKILEVSKKQFGKKILSSLMGACASRLYNDLINGHGKIPEEKVLLEWLYLGSQYNDNDDFFTIVQWVQECINQQEESKCLTPTFTNLAELILRFSGQLSPSRYEGIPEDIVNILPAFSAKTVVFRIGDIERAKDWVNSWIKKRASNYLKIVDPYFSPEQLEFISDIKRECKILIVTTNKHFVSFKDGERIRLEFESVWRRFCKGSLPQISCLIVPSDHSEQFHDRVIITSNGGLLLGQSLNGYGKKIGTIIELPESDAKEFERKYVDELLNNSRWFVEHNVQALIVKVG